MLFQSGIQLVSLTGKAGTGKTLLALAAAFSSIKDTNRYPCQTDSSAGEPGFGFLPGDLKEKMDPYMQPLYDNLTVIKHKFSHQSPSS